MAEKNEGKAHHRVVMLVDDNLIDNFINQKVMERFNFSKKIHVHTKAVKALEFLQELNANLTIVNEEIPSLLFLDLNMPVLTGFQFLQEFEKLSDRIKKKCKIVILSSSVNPADMAKSINNKHVLAFLNKPLLKSNLEQLEASMLTSMTG